MKALYWKELGSYLNNPLGYIVVILFAVFANFLFTRDIFAVGSASMRPFFDFLPWLMMIFIPALTMRSLSEEKRANTIETLLTLPISETQIVLAKFLALLTMVVIALALTLTLPVSLSFLSTMYLPEVIMGYIGAVALGALFVSISMLFSSLTKNQVVAFLTSVLALFFVIILSGDMLATIVPRAILDVLTVFSPTTHFYTFVKGLLDLRAVVYMISFTALFLGLTVIDLEKRG